MKLDLKTMNINQEFKQIERTGLIFDNFRQTSNALAGLIQLLPHQFGIHVSPHDVSS